MSSRTNQPLPVLGAQNWGSTLNNYLRNQEYGRQELEQDLQELYNQQNNIFQTVLSSGVMIKSVDSQKPGLYVNNVFVEDGSELDSSKEYYYKGWAAILGNETVSSLIEKDGKGGLKIEAPTLTSNIDARCVYAYYDVTDKKWSLKYGATTTPERETAISLDPYHICLGVIVKVSGKYYWNYKTMKSNLSISTKKWMLDEPHASLNTYMNINDEGKLEVYCDSSLPGTLTVQALGINPFSATESITTELRGDIKTFSIATGPNSSPTYGFYVLQKDGSLTTTGNLNLNTNKIYRLSATSITIDGKALLLLQEQKSSLDIDRAAFNDTDFNRLWYYCDPVELYRIKNGTTMKAAAGSGLSPINANGINPHVTTLIRDTDNVLFGSTTSKACQFIASDLDRAIQTRIPRTNRGTNYMLTSDMAAIGSSIRVNNHFSKAGENGVVDNHIQLYRGESTKDYNNITLATKYTDTTTPLYRGAYAHFTEEGAIKLGTYKKTKDFNINSITGTNIPDAYINIKSSSYTGTDDKGSIQLEANYIDNYADRVTEATNHWQIKSRGTTPVVYGTMKRDDNDFSIFEFGSDGSKRITMHTDGKTADKPYIQVGGGGCELRPDGLTLPSGHSGVVIKDNITGIDRSKETKFTEYFHLGMDHVEAWQNSTDQGKQAIYSWLKGPTAPHPGSGHFYYFRTQSSAGVDDVNSPTIPIGINIGDTFYLRKGSNKTEYEFTLDKVEWKFNCYVWSGICNKNTSISAALFLTSTPSVARALGGLSSDTVLPACDLYILGFTITTIAWTPNVDPKFLGEGVSCNAPQDVLLVAPLKGALSYGQGYINSVTNNSTLHVDYVNNNSHLSVRALTGSCSILDWMRGPLNIFGTQDNGAIKIGENHNPLYIKKKSNSLQWDQYDYNGVSYKGFTLNGNLMYRSDLPDSYVEVAQGRLKALGVSGVWFYEPNNFRKHQTIEAFIDYKDYDGEVKNNQKEIKMYVPYMTNFQLWITTRDDKHAHTWSVIAYSEVDMWVGSKLNLNQTNNKSGYSANNNGKIASVAWDSERGAFEVSVWVDAWYTGGSNSGQYSIEIQIVDKGGWVLWPLTLAV